MAALLAASVLFSGVLLVAGYTRSLWLDEANTVWVADRDLGGIVTTLEHENNLPLYYVLLSWWMRWFGRGEIAVRTLSWIFYAASVPAMYLLASALTGDPRARLVTAAVYAGSTNVAFHAENVRMYSLLSLETIVTTLALVNAFSGKSRRRGVWLAVYIAATAAGAFTHYWYAFVALAQLAIWALVLGRPRPLAFVASSAAGWLPFAALWTRSALLQLASGANSWMDRPRLIRLGATVKGFFGPEIWRHAVLAAILLVIALEIEKGRWRPRSLAAVRGWLREPGFRLALAGLAITLVVPFLVSQIMPIYTPNRYTVIAVPFAALLVGLPLSRYGRGRIAWVACLWLLVSVSMYAYQAAVEMDGPETDRSAAALLMREARPHDWILYSGLSGAGIEYYLGLGHAAPRFAREYFPASVAKHPAWIDERAFEAHREALEREAESLAAAARQAAEREGVRIWVVEGKEAQVARTLLDHLGRQLRLERAIPFDTTCYRRILCYGASGPEKR